jgi:chromosome segregation ATPase
VAKEKFTALAERARLDATKTKRIRKEWYELLQTTARLQQERADVHQQINDLLGEVDQGRESKVKAKNMSSGLTVQLG